MQIQCNWNITEMACFKTYFKTTLYINTDLQQKRSEEYAHKIVGRKFSAIDAGHLRDNLHIFHNSIYFLPRLTYFTQILLSHNSLIKPTGFKTRPHQVTWGYI